MSSRDIANLKQGLVAAWIPSLGSTGYRLVDRVGSNHGVLTNMDAATSWGISGGNLGLSFDGINDHVIASQNQVTPSNDFSLSAWVTPSSANPSSVTSGIVTLGGLGNALVIGWRSGQCYKVEGSSSNSIPNLISDVAPQTNVQVHIAYTRKGSTNSIYINGKLNNTNTNSIQSFSNNVNIGSFDAIYDRLNGSVDDIRIYNRALSATEVSLLSKERGIGFKASSRTSSHFAKRYSYKPPKDKTYAAITRSQSDYDSLREGLVLAICPSITQGSGYRAPDLSGRGNHGTLTNADLSTFWKSDGGVSANFDGVDDRITGTLPIVSIAGVSFWIKPPGTINSSSAASYVLQLRSGGVNFWYIALGAATISFANEYITIFDENGYRLGVTDGGSISGWTHVGIRWNGSAYEIYLNGVQKTTTSFGTPRVGTTTANGLSIGSLDNTNFYTGQIDDVRVYSRSITPVEIRQLASRRGIGLQPTPRHTDYIETREKTYSVIVKSQSEHDSLREGLVGAWCPSVTGATGFTVPDVSHHGNNLTLSVNANTKYIPGKNGLSVDLNGGIGEGAYPSGLTGTRNFTLSIWVKLSASQGAADGLIPVFGQKDANANAAGVMMYYWYSGANAGKFMHSTASGSNRSEVNIATAVSITSQWAHVAMIRNSTLTNGGTFYINGIEYPLASAITIWDVTTTSKTRIAADAGGFRVGIFTWDDARVYNRALTEPEIKRLASNPNVGLRTQKQTMFYQFPSASRRRKLITGMP